MYGSFGYNKDELVSRWATRDPFVAATLRDIPTWMADPATVSSVLELRRHGPGAWKLSESTPGDARSAKIKLEANDAFRKGDYKKAFVLYSVCCEQSDGEPVYFLNRAAAALKLGLYVQAHDDAHYAFKKGFNLPKALFRSAQAHRFLGEFETANDNITMALYITGPGEDGKDDPTLMKELNEVRRLLNLAPEAQEAWLSQQELKTVDDVFGRGEVEKLIEARLAQKD